MALSIWPAWPFLSGGCTSMSSFRRALAVLAAVGLPGALALFQAGASAGEKTQPLPPREARPPVIVAEKKVVIKPLPAVAPLPVAVPGGVAPIAPDLDMGHDPAFTEGLTLPTDRKA